jgi:hypothetical protein
MADKEGRQKAAEHAQRFRLPDDVWEHLQQSAEANVRSRNAQLVWILRQWLREHQEGDGAT